MNATQQKLYDICDHLTVDPENTGVCLAFCNAAELLADTRVFYWTDSPDYVYAQQILKAAA